MARNEYLPNSTSAVKEALMGGNTESDYLLFIDGKAIAVVEAKREENPLGDEVKKQAEDYAVSPQDWYGLWFEKLIPLVYMANGNKIYFKNMLVENSDYEELSQMHSPKKMLQSIGKKSEYGALPLIEKRGLRDCQYRAEVKFEESLKMGNKKNLAVLATGSGKTYLACLAAYRLLKHEMTKQEAQALVKYNDDIKNHRWASKPQIRKYDKVYNGKLRIVFGARSYIRDNDSEKLEDRLGDILVTLYEKAEENRIVREAREEAERKRVEEERRREENRQRKEQEIRLVKELVNKAEDYRIAKEIREYIQAMIDSGNEDITPEWIEWALKKADWYDPSIATEDEYLGKRQHEKSAEEKEKSLQDSIRKSWYW